MKTEISETKEKLRSLMRKSFPMQTVDESCIIMVSGHSDDLKPSLVVATGNHVTGDITWVNIRREDFKQFIHTAKEATAAIVRLSEHVT